MIDRFLNWLESLVSDVVRLLQDIVQYFSNLLETVFYNALNFAMTTLLDFVYTIIVSTGLFDMVLSAWQALPQNTRALIFAFEIPTAFSIVFGAYIVRFIIRRIPIIG